MSQNEKRDTDASFQGLPSFSSRPPPPGHDVHGAATTIGTRSSPPARDVHSAATAVGALSEEMLEALRRRKSLPDNAESADAPTTSKDVDDAAPASSPRPAVEAAEKAADAPPRAEAAAVPARPGMGIGALIIAALIGAAISGTLMWLFTHR